MTSSRDGSDQNNNRDDHDKSIIDVDDSSPTKEKQSPSKETSVAITQTEVIETKSVKTQTETSFYREPLKDSHDQYVSELEINSLTSYRPIYSLPLTCGKQPPLKIGMTLPKGKKRKVFYPDEENAS